MRKGYLILPIVFAFCLLFGNKSAFAQEESRRQFINVEIQVKKKYFIYQTRVPVSKNPFAEDGKKFIEGEFYVGSFVTFDCFNCFLSGSEYDFLIYAVPVNENSVQMSISLTKNKRKCRIEDKKIVLERGKRQEIDLKCGIKIAAYYE